MVDVTAAERRSATGATLDKIPPADFHNIANPLINDAWNGKISVREALTKSQDRINALIQQSGT